MSRIIAVLSRTAAAHRRIIAVMSRKVCGNFFSIMCWLECVCLIKILIFLNSPKAFGILGTCDKYIYVVNILNTCF